MVISERIRTHESYDILLCYLIILQQMFGPQKEAISVSRIKHIITIAFPLYKPIPKRI